MRKTIWTFLMILLSFTCSAQNTAKDKVEQIKSNAEYLCGEGWGDTYNSADQAALADLISKISSTSPPPSKSRRRSSTRIMASTQILR